jgi:putative Mg2+ transporter-C (MgtC) family protein
MSDVWHDIAAELPPVSDVLRYSLRLLVAALLGGLLGYERARSHKSAGLRTHVLVALGAATLVIATSAAGGTVDELVHVIQGTVSGIGFIGAGAILKAPSTERIHGLTTAASIWMTAALGIAAGLGKYWFALLAALVAWAVLGIFGRVGPDRADERAPVA